MRDLINKNVTEDDIMAAAEEVFRGGCTTLKLYFVIGFPMETDEDVQAIADVCLRVRESGRKVLGPRASRLQLNLSVNNFVPKPLTPFQWAGMAHRATLRARQEMLRSRLRKPGVRLTLHDVDKSFLEAALARGGEEYADIIEGAWRRGAFFDSWTERFRRDAWEAALAERGLDIEAEATKGLSRDSPLPWDVIENVADRDFLWTEWEKATRGETTPDCRWGVCADCGACGPGIGNDLAVKTNPLRTVTPLVLSKNKRMRRGSDPLRAVLRAAVGGSGLPGRGCCRAYLDCAGCRRSGRELRLCAHIRRP
jgi:hypothetical protein